jgi:hypothetical protein
MGALPDTDVRFAKRKERKVHRNGRRGDFLRLVHHHIRLHPDKVEEHV